MAPTATASQGMYGRKENATAALSLKPMKLADIPEADQAKFLADYQAELKKLATDSVHFIEGQRNVVTPLHASDVVVVPSVWREPFGRTVIEALATGRPVVASRVGGIPEILTGPLELEEVVLGRVRDGLHGLRD